MTFRARSLSRCLSPQPWTAEGRAATMLEALARYDIRLRWVIVAVWIVGALAAPRALPSLSSVSQSNNVPLLPASAPSQQATGLAAALPKPNPAQTAVLGSGRAERPPPGAGRG